MTFDRLSGPWSGDSDGSADDVPQVNRRWLLQASGAGLAAGLAGCAGGPRERTYEASWVSLAADGRPSGVSFVGDDEVTTTRTEELSDFSVEATIVSHTATYDRSSVAGEQPFGDGSTIGLVATPEASEFGQTLNPVARNPIEDLLTGDAGKAFLRQLDVDPSWSDGPRQLRATDDQLLGTATTVETYAGTTGDDEFVLLNAAKVTVDGDVVLVGEAHTRPASEGTDADTGAVDRAVELFVPILPLVVRERDPGSEGTPTTDEPAEFPPGRIPMDEVPKDIRKRAVRLAEDAAGAAVTWEDPPSLGTFAHVVERPDVEGVAYYELALEPKGFVVAATGKHDAPLPHFSTDTAPMGVELEKQGEGELGRLVWIDRLRYVAEDPEGNVLATRGNQVPKIEGLEALLEYDDEGPRSVEFGPHEDLDLAEDDRVDEGYEAEQLLAENDVDPPEEFSFERWESHEQLLDGYEEAYGPLLADLAEWGAEQWAKLDDEASVRRVGAGQRHREPLLDGEAVGAVGGHAAGAATARLREREAAHDVLEVVAPADASPGDSFDVTIEDGDGGETLTYHVEDDGGNAEGPAGEMDWVGAESAPGNKYWAGGFPIQPKYHQFDHDGCKVGCGPVAWALLFGWGDQQAHGGKFNSTWWPRYGLYLDGGGRWSNGDEQAPDHNGGDNGGPKEVMKELNRHVNVFCVGDSGATAPWDMDEANRYLWGRTGTKLTTVHSWTGRPIPAAKRRTRRSIKGNAPGKGRTPTIVGKGWLSHYPMAFSYWQIWWKSDKVKVNNGWGGFGRVGGSAIEWISATSWFSGEIYP
jgi:hypothetical protein